MAHAMTLSAPSPPAGARRKAVWGPKRSTLPLVLLLILGLATGASAANRFTRSNPKAKLARGQAQPGVTVKAASQVPLAGMGLLELV